MNNEFWPIIVPMTPCPDSSISNSRPRGVLDPEEVTRVVDAVSPRHLKLFQCGVLAQITVEGLQWHLAICNLCEESSENTCENTTS